MLSTTTITDPVNDGAQCACCQHRVDVRGVEQVVCLAHLTVYVPTHEGACADFEPKAARPFALRAS
jgi:hypothetical protein